MKKYFCITIMRKDRLTEDQRNSVISFFKKRGAFFQSALNNTISENNTTTFADAAYRYKELYFNTLSYLTLTNPSLRKFKEFVAAEHKLWNKRNAVMADNIVKNIDNGRNIVVLCGILHKPYLIQLLRSKLDRQFLIE